MACNHHLIRHAKESSTLLEPDILLDLTLAWHDLVVSQEGLVTLLALPGENGIVKHTWVWPPLTSIALHAGLLLSIQVAEEVFETIPFLDALIGPYSYFWLRSGYLFFAIFNSCSRFLGSFSFVLCGLSCLFGLYFLCGLLFIF